MEDGRRASHELIEIAAVGVVHHDVERAFGRKAVVISTQMLRFCGAGRWFDARDDVGVRESFEDVCQQLSTPKIKTVSQPNSEGARTHFLHRVRVCGGVEIAHIHLRAGGRQAGGESG
jgi:hypothetical protein